LVQGDRTLQQLLQLGNLLLQQPGSLIGGTERRSQRFITGYVKRAAASAC
jgi:hypothetical protein